MIKSMDSPQTAVREADDRSSLSSDREDALFRGLIAKIASLSDPKQLLDTVGAALKLMLRRPEDADILQALTDTAIKIVG